MEEDGKKRHIYQLKAQKDEVLKSVLNKTLNQHFQYMEKSIQGVKFAQYLFSCCWISKFKRLDPRFRTAFNDLQVEQKVSYYRKYLQESLMLAKKKSHFAQSNNLLQELPIRKQMINVLCRNAQDRKWKDLTVTLDYINKTIESSFFRVDLHKVFVIKLKNLDRSIFLKSWIDNRNDLHLTDNKRFDFLFQRISKMAREAIQENIVRLLDGQNKIKLTQSNQQDQPAASERSLDQRLNLSQSERQSAKHTIKEVTLVSYLTYTHPSEPFPQTGQTKRLKPSKSNKHYFLEDDWEINSEGELVVVNQKKLEAQGSVIKYIAKMLFTGSKLLNISLPVTVFNQESNLSLLLCSYAHAPLELEPASRQKDALKRFLKVVRFNLLGHCSYVRCDKPFNPILGQTYQALVDGTLFYGEQISHHPPISSLFVKGRGYTAYGSFEAQLKFGANSAKGNNKGWLKISFDERDLTKKIVKVNNIPGEMGGILIGKRTLNMVEQSYYIDQQNMLFLCLKFGEVKLTKNKQFYDSVQGKVVRLKKGSPVQKAEEIKQMHIEQELGVISGRWLSQVFFNLDLLIDTRLEPPPEIQRYPAILPSDYSLRQDIMLKRRRGDDQQCQTAKQKLQQIQRNDRKLRENYKR